MSEMETSMVFFLEQSNQHRTGFLDALPSLFKNAYPCGMNKWLETISK
jgi:hypothetical protein